MNCMKNPIVRVEHLSHRYTVQWAIEDINFEIEAGGIVGLLGSNGAGKSTTMNIICGVLNQTRGEVFIDGVNLREHPVEAKRNIGFLPQKPPLYPDLNVEEYLRFCADLRFVAKKDIQSAVNRAMARCGITHFKDRLIRNLSGGYQQRVGIAQAIVHDPKFVILDEPTNGLDPNQIVEVRNLIREIASDRTVLLSTHILSEVQATCRDIKMIECGRVVFSGTVDDFDNYIKPNTLLACFGRPPLEEELLAVEGITRVKKVNERSYRLWFDGGRDASKEVVKSSVKHGWELEEIHFEKSSLDAVFAKLSNKEIREL